MTMTHTHSVLAALNAAGQQIWLDNLSRDLLDSGKLAASIAQGIRGITSNPAIFHKAIASGQGYAADLAQLKTKTDDLEARYEALVIADVQRACDLLADLHRDTHGDAGWVSLEVSPALAFDVAGTVANALRLKAAVNRDNLLIKIPATDEGVVAIEELLAQGVSINVTLMFSLADVDAVTAAYVRGARRLATTDPEAARRLRSVASLFLSRVDSTVDSRLDAIGSDEALAMRGQTAVAMTRLAYQAWQQRFQGDEFADLRAQGVRPQSMLWASTGTKNPAYSDLLYVEPVVGPDTINTLPDGTLAALLDHGQIQPATLMQDVAQAEALYARQAELGLHLDEVGAQLKADGLKQFEQAFAQMLALMA